ncbi:hypothetical protein [Lederbergia lenta]|uniref:hypothetical protein n=1 Tax=Lederbergia lenta TaxID=1467 RepID=UPI0032E7FCAC
MSLTVNLCAKEPEQFVNYGKDSFNLDQQKAYFPIEIDVKEVIELTKKKRKEYKKIVKSFIATGMSYLTLSSRSMAQTKTTPLQPEGALGLPIDFIEPMMTLLVLALAVAFVLAMVLMMSAGAMRMFRQKKLANDWTEDILRGFTQILLSIPVIFVIYYVAVKMLKVSELFMSPF